MRTHPRAAERIIQRLDFEVVRRLDGRIQGDHRTSLYGDGLDFADLREYQVGDDARHIDWNVTARLDTPYVRTYLEDRDVNVWFLIDRSASMQFGSLNESKAAIATDFVATMARFFTRNGNRVGAVLCDGAVEQVVDASSGRRQVLRITEHMLRPPPPTPPRPSSIQQMTDLAAMLSTGARLIPRRSVVFVISDFLSSCDWQREMRQLGHRHDVVAIAVDDPAEHELPDAGLVVVEDSETGEQITIDASDPAFRRRFADATTNRTAELERSLRRSGVDSYGLSTDDDLLEKIVSIAARRKRRC